jgi:hypothetical protein
MFSSKLVTPRLQRILVRTVVLGDLGFVGLGSALGDGYLGLVVGFGVHLVLQFDLTETVLEHVVLVLEVGADCLCGGQLALQLLDLVGQFLLLQEPHVLLQGYLLVL